MKSYGRHVAVLILIIWFGAINAKPHGAIASAHPLATEAGMRILEQGGNAFDAAITVASVLSVVAPYHSGMGGGGFWLLHDEARNQDIVIDAREVAPLGAHEQLFVQNGEVNKQLSTKGALAAAIPGQVSGLGYLSKNYASMPLDVLMQPAIDIAEQGFPIDSQFAQLLQLRAKKLRQFPSSVRIFFKGDVPLLEGDKLVQRDLANTLRIIAQKGDKGFYSGVLAHQMVDAITQAGGIWTLADLQAYKVKIRQPLKGQYHDMQLTLMPPPSAGGVAILTAFNILSTYEMDDLSEADKIHLIAESWRRAYCDRSKYLGDPDFVSIPLNALLKHEHAQQWRLQMRMNRASKSKTLACGAGTPEGEHTTHYSIVDGMGNRVAATLTVNHWFGSGMVIPGVGIMLNNEMDDFASSEGVSNAYGLIGHRQNFISPQKRPLSSMSPSFFETNEGIGILGTPGGSRIPTMVFLALFEAQKSKDPLNWVSLPRFHHQYLPDVISFEPGAFSPELQRALMLRGHRVEVTQRPYGDMQAIYIDKETKRIQAASDPRGVGLALVR